MSSPLFSIIIIIIKLYLCNLMTYASKLKLDRGIPGEPILYLSGKYHMLWIQIN